MGDFNKTGFISHLPIQCGDEIVMFVCADQSKSDRRENCPISVTGNKLTPICPPFFGEYNDYGGIEKVVDDANHKYFTEVIGMTIEEFDDLINDMCGYTIKDFRDGIKKYEDDPDSENHCHHETKEDFEQMLALYEKLFKAKQFEYDKFLKGLDEESANKVKKSLDEVQSYVNGKIDNTAIVTIMEHKSVYDKMVETGRKEYFSGWIAKDSISIEEMFDNTLKLYRKLKEDDENIKFNPFTADAHAAYSFKDAYGKFFGMAACLHDTLRTDDVDYALYKDFDRDFEEFKDIFVDYAYFLFTMHRMCITFETSPYHSQTVSYNILIPVFEGILDTLKKSAEEREYTED
jgi:hypothetical protein